MVYSGGDRVVGALEALFTRLAWPSLMVRERTCCAIAQALDTDRGEEMKEGLLQWIRKQQLESLAAVGVLAAAKGKLLGAGFAPAPAEITDALQVPSLLSSLILEAAFDYSDATKIDARWASGQAPKDFRLPEEFNKHFRTCLPRIYEEYRQDLDDVLGGTGFSTQWAFEWTRLRERSGLSVSWGTYSFVGRREDKHLAGADFPGTEIYTSSFLRALAWCVIEEKVNKNEATALAAKTCPVDLTLWQVPVNTESPAGWPRLEQSSGTIDTQTGAAVSAAERIAKGFSNNASEDVVLFANGPMQGTGGLTWLKLVAFLQRTTDPERPDGESVLQAFSKLPAKVVSERHPLMVEGPLPLGKQDQLILNVADWELLPLAIPCCPLVPPRWQHWRGMHMIHLPNCNLGHGALSLTSGPDSLVIHDANTPMGWWSDWADKLEERHTANLPPRAGQILVARSEAVLALADAGRASLCWAWEVTIYSRASAYREYESHRISGLAGGSSIITVF
jgi:hypothetical protein